MSLCGLLGSVLLGGLTVAFGRKGKNRFSEGSTERTLLGSFVCLFFPHHARLLLWECCGPMLIARLVQWKIAAFTEGM